jgi:4-amino-4-deoxy-L-arabinose transferase-like glycosyltransferase
MEGGMVDHIARVVSGQAIYGKPSLSFTPFLYPPLYYWVCAPVTWFTGLEAQAGRLISILSTCGIVAIILMEVRRRTQSWRWALIGGGLFAGCFELCGAWYDLARVDSLFLFLLFLVGYLVAGSTRPAQAALAGVVAALCILTKQSAVTALAPLWLVLLWINWRAAIWFAISATAVAGVTLLVLYWRTDGWVWYYIFDIPNSHPYAPDQYLAFFSDFLFRHLPLGGAAILGLIVMAVWKNGSHADRVWAGWVVGVVIASAISLTHLGWYYNVLMPAYAAAALATPLVLYRLLHRLPERFHRIRPFVAVAVAVLLAVQMTSLLYSPFKHIPTEQDRAAGDRIIRMIAEIDGEVIMPHFGNMTARAGKSRWVHQMALNDILKGDLAEDSEQVRAARDSALEAQAFAGIIVSAYQDGWINPGLYREASTLFADSTTFFPRTGFRIRPEKLYVPIPKENPSPGGATGK